MITREQGNSLVKHARQIITDYFNGVKSQTPENLAQIFLENRGCFVTLKKHPSNELRGCIGYAEPIFPLGLAIEKSSLAAALEDPRFPSITPQELDGLIVEVSVLTPPELIGVVHPIKIIGEIVVGRDGLIIEHGFYKGLLLPQVPGEYGWDVKTFLEHTCMKAGLGKDDWMNVETKIYKFQAQVFKETQPHGEIIE